MLLVDRVTVADGDRLSVETTVRSTMWYADADGNMPAWVGIELMAQAIAAYFGLWQLRHGLPIKIGFLLGTRKYVCSVPVFTGGAVLDITADMQYREPNGLGAFDCYIDNRGERLATAMIKVYEPEDIKKFMEETPS
ncbi:MAG: beta-hydroxyacyl-ACP dehydratase [Gammaproteobacteria bacterium]|nr:beta-hydroxyacyl-ACP dehydratase [Gammaproteobacteria bacterium]